MQMRSQTKRNRLRNTAVSALCAVLLAACSESPESMVASAKDYMAKDDRNAASIQLKNALQKNPGFPEARYLLGKVYMDQGDYASAEKELMKANDAGFKPDLVIPTLAQALLNSGQSQRVVVELSPDKLVTSEAKASLLTSRGFAQLVQGKRQLAQDEFQAALKASAGYPLARVGLARLKAVDKDLDGALADIDDILKSDPKSPEAHALRGDIMLTKGRPVDAITDFEAVIAARPTDIAAYQAIVSLQIRLNKLDDAQAKISALRKAVGNHPLALYLQAFVDFRRGKGKEAYDAILQVLRVAPDHVPSLMMASALQLQRNDFVQAQENLNKVLAKVPNQPFARRLLVSSYLGLRDPARALESLQPLIKDNADDVSVLSLAGQVYAMNGDFKRSEEFFSRAAKADPANAGYRTRLGLTRLAGGESEQAFQDLEAASSMDADSIQADVTLIMAHLRRNETAKAMAAVEVLEKKKPKDPITYNMKGGVLLAMKDSAGARQAFEKALELQQSFLPAVSNLARLDIQAKQLDVARKRYDTFVEKNPNSPQGYLQYAEFLAMTGAQVKDIQALLEKGMSTNPGSLPVRMALIRMLAQSGETKRALTLAQEASAASPEDPTVLDLLGRAQVAAGEMQQAQSTYSKLVTRVPNSIVPLIALADIYTAGKDMPAAEQSLRKALAIKPDALEVQQRLIAVLASTNRGDAAVALVREIQRQRKDSAIGYMLEGEVQNSLKKPLEAVAAFEEAYKRDKTVQPLVRLHNARLAAGQTQEAAKLIGDWLRANPKDLNVRTYLAERALAEKKYESAVQQYRQMLEIAPKNAMLLNNLAWALGKLNDKSALSVAQQALALAPNSPVVLDTVGVLQLESGDLAKGVESLKKAVSLGPNQPQLRLNLAKAQVKTGDKDGARKTLEAGLKSVQNNTPIRKEMEQLLSSL